MTDLDFHGPWREDLMQQQRIRFLAADTHDERRAAADRINELRGWKERAEHGTGDI